MFLESFNRMCNRIPERQTNSKKKIFSICSVLEILDKKKGESGLKNLTVGKGYP